MTTLDTTLNPTPPAQGSAPAIPEDVLFEISNLRQENIELHEKIAVQREEIALLQRTIRRERLSAMQAIGAVQLLRAVLRTPVGQVCRV